MIPITVCLKFGILPSLFSFPTKVVKKPTTGFQQMWKVCFSPYNLPNNNRVLESITFGTWSESKSEHTRHWFAFVFFISHPVTYYLRGIKSLNITLKKSGTFIWITLDKSEETKSLNLHIFRISKSEWTTLIYNNIKNVTV